MKPGVKCLEAPAIDVGVELGRRDIGVAQHFLNAPQVGAVLQQVRRKGVPQRVR